MRKQEPERVIGETDGKPVGRLVRLEGLERFQNFQFAARMIVEGFYAGRHRSPFHDTAAEFADYRPYTPGDEIRSLDWRAYARTDRDYIKLFRKETDMPCYILLDTSKSMDFVSLEPPPPKSHSTTPQPPLSKLQYGAYVAAALSYLMVRQGDKVSLATGGTELQTFVPLGGTIRHLHGLLAKLEGTRAAGTTKLATVLRTLFGLLRRRGCLVVISDFLEEPEALFDVLAMVTYRGWQVLLLHVLSPAELELPGEGSYRYQDSESEAVVEGEPEALRSTYQAELQAWLETLGTKAKSGRIHYTRITTDTPFDLALERYLTVRTG